MPEDIMLLEAIDAIHKGQRARARDLLTRLLKANKSNPEYWLWISSVVDTYQEQVYCLQSVLRLDPRNQAAKQGLVLLGAMPPDESIKPARIPQRKWETPLLEVPKHSFLKTAWANPFVRVFALFFLAILIFGGVVGGIYFALSRRPAQVAIVIPTRTAGASPTFTTTPTPQNFTPRPPTATVKVTGIAELISRLSATYTPTPLYVNTPHPINEAFDMGILALQRGEYDKALASLQQAQSTSPEAPDIPYYMGEILRVQGRYLEALDAYEQALSIDPEFGPAYLGRALVGWQQATLRSMEPGTDILQDLDAAIEKDPGFGQAFIERATYYLAQNELEKATEDLESAQDLLPGSPLVYVLRAQIELGQGNLEAALADARKANELDQTMLEGYRVLGNALVMNGDYKEAVKVLETYTTYETGDALGWLSLGEALFASGRYSDTLKSLDKAIDLDKKLAAAYLYRGLVYVELEQGQKAVNEIYYVLQMEPKSFDANLNFGRALLVANRLGDALGQITRSLEYTETDTQRAQVYYWRALTNEANGNKLAANMDWKLLLGLPEEAVPPVWWKIARQRLAPTATITPTPSRTPTPTRTLTPTRTPVSSRTPTLGTPSRTPLPTNPTPKATLPTATPTITPLLPSRTPTPTPM